MMTAQNPKVPGTELEGFLQSWEQRKELAATLLKSGFLPPAYKTVDQVIAVMLKGQELGIPVMEALNGINVVSGKPTISPQLMLALVRRSRELEDMKIEYTDDACVVTIKRRGQAPHTTRFGVAEARALNLLGRENYIRQPRTMYQWRALAANLRVTFPDVIGGVYTPEEMGAEIQITEDGSQVVVNPEVQGAPMQGGLEDNLEIDELTPPPPAAGAEGTAFRTFDPTRETLTFGKYAGARWSEVPEDYLNWLKGNATSREIISRVEATLRWRDLGARQAEQVPSALDETFGAREHSPKERESGPEGRSSEGQEETPLGALLSSLESVAARGNVREIRQWADENKARIESLSADARTALRRAYTRALDRAREIDKETT